ncbi:TetR/AcrR family transcriptional regulator [Frankia sp. R43]|uniref:TetR/AcrR family transcriptional regulator n=1 Tax=Frankia sp. R43 TaxID=269536 RepID=UPI0009F966A3|nr:TetR/AcrR family transcriptional regulator [Frankia sp. R43]
MARSSVSSPDQPARRPRQSAAVPAGDAGPAPAEGGRRNAAGRRAGGGRAAGSGESERRAAIVGLAADLFAERGYRATTVREIADAAGMLSGSLYHHFDSKESIIDELLSSYLDDLHREYEAIVERGGTAIDQIDGLVRAAFSSVARHRAAVTVFQNERVHLIQLPRFAYLTAAEQSTQRLWMKVLRDGIAAGQLRADLDPKITYRLLRDSVWVSVRWYSPSGRLSPDQLADHFLRMLLDGIRPHGPATDADDLPPTTP